MLCPRCHGYCVLSTERAEDCEEVEQWRCIQCSYRTEELMEQNRRMQETQ